MQFQADAKTKLVALRRLIEDEKVSTQDELRERMEALGFDVTQSTISRSLRKLGAVKVIDEAGRTIYRLSSEPSLPATVQTTISDLILDIDQNGSMIVLHTPPGSASLVARHLDNHRPDGILGTIAGDDTIFIAPSDVSQIKRSEAAIRECLGISAGSV